MISKTFHTMDKTAKKIEFALTLKLFIYLAYEPVHTSEE